eukprot:gene24973-53096_t
MKGESNQLYDRAQGRAALLRQEQGQRSDVNASAAALFDALKRAQDDAANAATRIQAAERGRQGEAPPPRRAPPPPPAAPS